MSRTTEVKARKSPEQHEAEYTWLSPAEVAVRIGVGDPDTVRELIREGYLCPPGVMDVGRGKLPRYKISPAAVERFIADSEARVRGT